MKNNLAKKKRKGFTLIELIIVLAVMAIIAAIAIPSFSAIRDNAATKADEQSKATVERTVLMLAADGDITDGIFTINVGDSVTVVKTGETIADGKTEGEEAGKVRNALTIKPLKGKDGDKKHIGITVEVKESKIKEIKFISET